MKVFRKSLKCKTKTYKNISKHVPNNLENTIGVEEITGGPKFISNKLSKLLKYMSACFTFLLACNYFSPLIIRNHLE